MAIALVTNVIISGGANGGTSSGVDTTGATLIVFYVASFFFGVTPTLSDSNGNAWSTSPSPLADQRTAGGDGGRLYFCLNPTVGAGHTFTLAGVGTFCSGFIEAFSGTAASSPLDQNTGANGTGSTGQPGSITPSADNYVVVSGVGGGMATTAINSSMTITNSRGVAGGGAEGGALAYIIQTTAGAINPTWTFNGSIPYGMSIASFKIAAAGGTTNSRLINKGLLRGGQLMGGKLVREAA